ncbi:hypothetical protein [Amycolatopsis sp. DG1A-15b]|uniref:hypothetical protein n=1 Tax=Amycolatopsis sp. DG1A-15b TaxID=3052846 RepID=UPI00255B5328|nr:hypothetical protein [Amycolatopsis sp. DG1A-15b]WIX93720.1 hypothetical protein QRY02_19170 [Amycolatopsis sp. DG1A-15b]
MVDRIDSTMSGYDLLFMTKGARAHGDHTERACALAPASTEQVLAAAVGGSALVVGRLLTLSGALSVRPFWRYDSRDHGAELRT